MRSLLDFIIKSEIDTVFKLTGEWLMDIEFIKI